MSEQPAGSADDAEVMTVGERARRAGLSDARIAMHLEGKRLLLDEEIVTDLDTPAPPGSRINVAGS